MIRTTRTRRGVTLVEMMVAAALSITGMWLLTWVYQQGIDSFRLGNATANLSTQERMVASIMTRDLKADHFLEEDNKPNRGRRLSDQTKSLGDGTVYTPPKSGYFWTRSNQSGATSEGSDSYGYTSTRSFQNFIQFTAILPGGRSDQTVAAEVPYVGTPTIPPQPTQVFGTAFEVSYYLVKTGKSANGLTDVFDLYRAQKLVARTTDDNPSYAPWVDASTRPDGFRRKEREIADVRAAVDERIAGTKQAAKHASRVQLVQPEGHAAVGIGAEIEMEPQVVRRSKERHSIVRRMKAAGEAGQAVPAVAGQRNAAVRAQQRIDAARHQRATHQSESSVMRA